MKQKFTLLILLTITSILNAQSEGSNFVVGQNFSIISTALNQDRDIQIYTPEEYQDSGKSYPVLYLLDGQRWYLHAVSLQNLFSEYKYTPDFIIVSIPTEDPGRFGFFNNSSKLLAFLEQDVMSFVDDNFRTSNERLLFGWQFAGSFALQTLIEKPQLFNGYFIASPIPIREKKLADMDDFFTKHPNVNASIFFTTSVNEGEVEKGAEQLALLLKNKAPANLYWTYKKLQLENISSFGHRTTPFETLYYGLRSYYQDYTLLEFDDIQSYQNAGGFSFVEKYYENRADKYAVSSEIPSEGMFFLLKMSLDADDIDSFDFFIRKFSDQGLYNYTNRGWTSRYAEFYVKHDEVKKAVEIYEVLARKHPNHEATKNRLNELKLKRNK